MVPKPLDDHNSGTVSGMTTIDGPLRWPQAVHSDGVFSRILQIRETSFTPGVPMFVISSLLNDLSLDLIYHLKQGCGSGLDADSMTCVDPESGSMGKKNEKKCTFP
jgi:hypothetical protein